MPCHGDRRSAAHRPPDTAPAPGLPGQRISFAIAASMMLCVAIVELLPSIRPSDRALLTPRQAAFVLTGIACVSATQWVAEMWI